MKFIARLEKSKDFWFLLMTSFIFFLLRLPSLFEPYWYGDEGIYEVLGSAIRHGRILYSGIWDNKPPLLYITYALFNGDQFYVRIASLVFGIFAVIAFFFLAKKLFGHEKRETVLWITSIFAFMLGLPLLEGNIANAENFMLVPIILSALLLFRDRLNSKIYFSAGIVLGLAFLFKIVAIFDFLAFCTFIFIVNTEIHGKKINLDKMAKQALNLLAPFAVGFLAPILVTGLFFLGPSFKYFLQATFTQNVGYVGYGNKFIIPQGFLILKLLLLAGFNIYLFLKKTKFTKTSLFILTWLSFSLFNAFFSQRPYTHYLLVLLPALTLMIGLTVLEKKYKIQAAILLALTVLLVFINFNFYRKTPLYYQNFVTFITGVKSVREYRAFFDKKTPIDYEIAEYIKSKAKSSDQIFIWGNNAQVYKLTNKLPPGRYAVAYHITGYSEGFKNTRDAIQKSNPKFIIIMPKQPTFPFSLNGYLNAVTIENVTIYERAI